MRKTFSLRNKVSPPMSCSKSRHHFPFRAAGCGPCMCMAGKPIKTAQSAALHTSELQTEWTVSIEYDSVTDASCSWCYSEVNE